MKTSYKFNTLITDRKPKNEYSGSIFLITINSNKSMNTRDPGILERIDEIEKCLKEISDVLFSEKNVMKLLCVPLENKQKENIDPENVKSIKVNSQLEANREERGFVHLHTTINVVHKKKIQIDLNLLKRVVYRKMNDCLTFNGKFYKPYVNVRGQKTAYSIEQYANTETN